MNLHLNYSEEITETDAFRDISGSGLCMRCFIVYPWVLDRIFGSCVPEQGFLQEDTWLAREENLREKGLQRV